MNMKMVKESAHTRVAAIVAFSRGGGFVAAGCPMAVPRELGMDRRRGESRGWRERPNGRWWGFVLALAVLGAAGPDGGACGQMCNFEVVAIVYGEECSPGDVAGFVPWAVDHFANVAGSSSCSLTDHAAIWTGGPIAIQLAGPPSTSESIAFDLIAPEHVVGRARPTGQNLYRAAYWPDGQGILLPLLPGANTGQALGINAAQVIVGESNNTVVGGQLKAFRWEAGQIEPLELPFGVASRANDINRFGQITGWMGTSFATDSHAFVWTNGEVVDLGVIPGGNSANGKTINVHGHVAGDGQVPNGVSTFGDTHALLWDGSAMTDLGTLPGHTQSNAYDINDVDQVVGRSFGSLAGNFAFLWQGGQMHKLQDLVVDDLGGKQLIRAHGISNDGWIIAYAGDVSFLLRPVDSAAGDIDNNCIVNVCDLLLLLGQWGVAESFADTNEDGHVNVTDLLQVLVDWG